MNEDVVAISGLNGVGKTSILDALYFLCVGKSYFSGTDVQCINNNEEIAGIRARVFKDEDIELKIKFKRGARKVIEQNGVVCKKVLDYIGQFFAVVIAPGDIELIYGSNETRRGFVNQILSQTNTDYLKSLVRYNKLIEQRNRHLKQDIVDNDLLNTFDGQIAPLAKALFKAREEFMFNFSDVFKKKYFELAGEKENVKLTYVSQLSDQSYLDLAANNRAKDLAVQRSFTGVHKDEILVELDQMLLKRFGSQGQIKSALIALKLAEYEYVSKVKKVKPFLLLDDIFEKIDEDRATILTQIIKRGNFGQIFITDTNEDRLNRFCLSIGKSHQTITL